MHTDTKKNKQNPQTHEIGSHDIQTKDKKVMSRKAIQDEKKSYKTPLSLFMLAIYCMEPTYISFICTM